MLILPPTVQKQSQNILNMSVAFLPCYLVFANSFSSEQGLMTNSAASHRGVMFLVVLRGALMSSIFIYFFCFVIKTHTNTHCVLN